MNKLEELIEYYNSNKRVCPQPQIWNKLWEMLKNKKREENSWVSSLPLILNAWYFSENETKKMRFIEHLYWAENQKQIKQVSDFLYSLKETDWHHENE